MAEQQGPGFEYDEFAPQTSGRLFSSAMFGFNKEEVLEYLDEMADENVQRQEAAELQLQEAAQKREELEKKNQDLSERMRKLEQNLASARKGGAPAVDTAQFEADQQQLQQYAEELEIAKAATQQAEEDLAELRDRLFNAQQENEWLREEFQKGEERSVELQKKLEESDGAPWVDSAEMDQQRAENERLLAENERLLAEIELQVADNGKLADESKRLLSENEKLLQESESLIAKKEEALAEALAAGEAQTGQQAQALAALQARLEEQDEELKAVMAELAAQDEERKAATAQVTAREAELTELRLALEESQKGRARSEQQILDGKTALVENERALVSARLQLAENERGMAALQQQLEDAQASLRQREQDGAAHNREILQRLEAARQELALEQKIAADTLKKLSENEKQFARQAQEQTEVEDRVAQMGRLLEEARRHRDENAKQVEELQGALEASHAGTEQLRAEADNRLAETQRLLGQSREQIDEKEQQVANLRVQLERVERELQEERSIDHSAVASAAIIADANAEAERIRAMALDEKDRIRRQIRSSAGGLAESITNLRGDVSGVEGSVTEVLQAVQTSLADILTALSRTEQNLGTLGVQMERFPATSASVPKPPHQQQVVYFQPSEVDAPTAHKAARSKASPPESYGRGGFRRVWPEEEGAKSAPKPFKASHSTSPVAQAAAAYWPDELPREENREERLRALAENLVGTLVEMMD